MDSKKLEGSSKSTGESENTKKKNSQNSGTKQQEEWSFSGTNCYRYETWNTFLANKSPLNNDYPVSGDRLALTLKYQLPWTTFTSTLDGVKFFNLPNKASFGAGSTYFSNGNEQNFGKVFFRTLNFTFKRIGDKGMSGTIGRFDYSNGTECKSDNKTVDWVKSNRISDRLIGTSNWTLYQRSMNGIYLKRDNGRFQGAASAWCPTAGTYSKQAGDIMTAVKVLTLAGTFKYNTFFPNQEFQLFCYNYDDSRAVVAARADNTVTGAKKTASVSTGGIDVNMRTYGCSAVGAYESSDSTIDTMVWFALQRGDWYNLAHKAYAYAVEAGYQWKKTPWKPWFRAGLNQSSGDSNPNDGDHKTFFCMMPTRKYSGTCAYNLMNARDTFAQLMLKPNTRLQVRFDYHQLKLAESADRWYTGGGAMSNTGTVNGFTARSSGGKTDLGSAIEFTGTYTLNKNFKTTLYASRFNGGDVIENSFAAEKNQKFSYIELIYDF
ncbi:MAG: alginate export family protein [Candidatus Ozemobacteraceae bacterium]